MKEKKIERKKNQWGQFHWERQINEYNHESKGSSQYEMQLVFPRMIQKQFNLNL